MLHIGSASAFQAEGVSSILIIRSRSGYYNGRRPVSETENEGPIPSPEASPCIPAVEEADLKSVKRKFESCQGHNKKGTH